MASLWYALFKWNIPPVSEKELKTAQAIVTQAHGRMRDGSGGPGNLLMAEVARTLHARLNLPILPQEDLSIADPTLPFHTVIGGSATGKSTLQWNTFVIAARQAEICRENGWLKVIVVAFPLHMGRAVAVYRKAGLIPFAAAMPSNLKAYMHPDLVPGGLLGIQTVPRYALREFLVRLMFLKNGWM